MKVKGSRKIIRRLGLALAVATVLAPAAQAMPHGVDGGKPVSQARERQYADDLRDATSFKIERRGYTQINPLARPDLMQPTRPVANSSSSEFNWGDASIGAGVVFGVMLIGFAIVYRRYGRGTRLAAT